jgi:hypothetical protein
MQYIEQTLCATYNELTNPITGIMTVNALNWSRRKGELKQLSRGGNGREALFAVDSLPLQYKNEVYRRYPDLEQSTRASSFVETVTIDGAARAFFVAYTFDNGKYLPDDVVDEYTNNASIFNRFAEMLQIAHGRRVKVSAKRLNITEFWKDKAEFLPLITDQLAHTLPTHPRRLQTKYKEYMKDGYKTLISGRYANKNKAKVRTPEQEALIVRLLGDHRNWDNERIAELYNFIASNMGVDWQPITGRAVGYLREKNDLVTTAARRGSAEFYNNKAMQVKRSASTAPLMYWTADGWDVELFYQKTARNGKGHCVTTYSNRVTIVVILDTFNKYPVGYAIGDHETPELIKAALRNAADHTRELFGERYRTAQFQSDRYGIKTLTPVYAVMGDKVTPARAHNAKAKVIEPYFNHLNKKYCQLLHNWSGFGITSRKDRQPNWELQNKIRHSFPDLDGVIEQINQIMAIERQTKRAEYCKAFKAIEPQNLLPLSAENYLLTFGADTGKRNAIEGGGIRPTIKGVKRDFDCFDPKFRQYAHVKWLVKYDPADLSQALAVSEDGTLRFMLENKYIQPMALADRKAGDAEQLARINEFNTALVDEVAEKYSLAGETSERLILENPNLRNSLAKTLLCNSLGQHKDERNAVRHALESGGQADTDKHKKRVTINIPSVDDVAVVKPCQKAAQTETDILDLY